MIQKIYKAILVNGFTSKGQDGVNNKRLGIKRTFRDAIGRYIEIYPEKWGYSVFIYGNGFMNGYYPHCFSVTEKKDADHLCKFMARNIGIFVVIMALQ